MINRITRAHNDPTQLFEGDRASTQDGNEVRIRSVFSDRALVYKTSQRLTEQGLPMEVPLHILKHSHVIRGGDLWIGKSRAWIMSGKNLDPLFPKPRRRAYQRPDVDTLHFRGSPRPASQIVLRIIAAGDRVQENFWTWFDFWMGQTANWVRTLATDDDISALLALGTSHLTSVVKMGFNGQAVALLHQALANHDRSPIEGI